MDANHTKARGSPRTRGIQFCCGCRCTHLSCCETSHPNTNTMPVLVSRKTHGNSNPPADTVRPSGGHQPSQTSPRGLARRRCPFLPHRESEAHCGDASSDAPAPVLNFPPRQCRPPGLRRLASWPFPLVVGATTGVCRHMFLEPTTEEKGATRLELKAAKHSAAAEAGSLGNSSLGTDRHRAESPQLSARLTCYDVSPRNVADTPAVPRDSAAAFRGKPRSSSCPCLPCFVRGKATSSLSELSASLPHTECSRPHNASHLSLRPVSCYDLTSASNQSRRRSCRGVFCCPEDLLVTSPVVAEKVASLGSLPATRGATQRVRESKPDQRKCSVAADTGDTGRICVRHRTAQEDRVRCCRSSASYHLPPRVSVGVPSVAIRMGFRWCRCPCSSPPRPCHVGKGSFRSSFCARSVAPCACVPRPARVQRRQEFMCLQKARAVSTHKCCCHKAASDASWAEPALLPAYMNQFRCSQQHAVYTTFPLSRVSSRPGRHQCASSIGSCSTPWRPVEPAWAAELPVRKVNHTVPSRVKALTPTPSPTRGNELRLGFFSSYGRSSSSSFRKHYKPAPAFVLYPPQSPPCPSTALAFHLLEQLRRDDMSLRCAVDIGGTLAKVVFVTDERNPRFLSRRRIPSEWGGMGLDSLFDSKSPGRPFYGRHAAASLAFRGQPHAKQWQYSIDIPGFSNSRSGDISPATEASENLFLPNVGSCQREKLRLSKTESPAEKASEVREECDLLFTSRFRTHGDTSSNADPGSSSDRSAPGGLAEGDSLLSAPPAQALERNEVASQFSCRDRLVIPVEESPSPKGTGKSAPSREGSVRTAGASLSSAFSPSWHCEISGDTKKGTDSPWSASSCLPLGNSWHVTRNGGHVLEQRLGASLDIRATPHHVIHFTYFRTKDVGSLIHFLKAYGFAQKGGVLRATGGGAHKFSHLLSERLGVRLKKLDEMESIMKGLVCLASSTDSVFRFDLESKKRMHVHVTNPLYPFLVVNIGSGVSILKASSPTSFVRVTGTCIGGGTVLGLARLLFHAKTFKEVVKLSQKGTDFLDLKVGDLFGDAAGSRCLPADTLASSFGRLYLMSFHEDGKLSRKNLRKEDIARSLIHMVSYNLGYLAYLVGTAHGVRRIFFAGKYINNHGFTMESITHGVNFYMRQYDLRPKGIQPMNMMPEINALAREGPAMSQAPGKSREVKGLWVPSPKPDQQGGVRIPTGSLEGGGESASPEAHLARPKQICKASREGNRLREEPEEYRQLQVEQPWAAVASSVRHTHEAGRSSRQDRRQVKEGESTTNEARGFSLLIGSTNVGDADKHQLAAASDSDGLSVLPPDRDADQARQAASACPVQSSSLRCAGGELSKDQARKDNLQKGTVWKSAAGEYAASAYDGSTQWTPPRPASEQKLTQRREMVLGAPQPPPFEVLFLRHDGYLGALGALVSADE